MKASPENRFVKSLDLVVDFATLGEYRVVTDAPRNGDVSKRSVRASKRSVRARDIWATDIDWSSRPRQREIECSLPRARDRALARERVRG